MHRCGVEAAASGTRDILPVKRRWRQEEEEEEEETATPISIPSRESEGTMTRRGHFSATESEDKGSSTGTTPKESQRKLVFHHKNQSPPGHALFWCIVGGSPSHGQGRGEVPRAVLAG